MESQHDDIGELIREKIDASDQKLDDAVWGEIQKTLKKEKRRRAYYTWSLNGLIVLFSIVSIFLLVASYDNKQSKTEETPNSRQNFKENEIISSNPILNDSISFEISNNQDSKYLKIVLNKESDSQSISRDKHSNKSKESNILNAEKETLTKNTNDNTNSNEFDYSIQESNSPGIEQNVAQRTQKVYYYYNSKDGQEVMTTDKKVIDSVMKSNAAQRDSIR